MLSLVYSRSTAVDLLSSRRVRDGRRQHIQHQLDSLRFYDSVPLYDGLRRFTPAAPASTSAAPDQSTGRGDSPWPPVPPTAVQPRHASKKRLRRVASEPTGQQKQPRAIWSLAGSGRPSAAPRWPTNAETAGGLRPRHWPPVNDRGPYWIRLESALTMAKPEDEENAVDDDGGTFEYRVDVPASEQRLPAPTMVNDHHHHHRIHGKTSSQQQEMYIGNGHQYPNAGNHYPGPDQGTHYPGPDQLQSGNSYPTAGHQYPTDMQQRVDAQHQYPGTEQSYLGNGHRYPSTGHQYPVFTQQPGSEQLRRDDGVVVDEYVDDDCAVRGAAADGEERNPSRERSYDRRRRQCHRQNHHEPPPPDATVTTPVVDPPRYEQFTHV